MVIQSHSSLTPECICSVSRQKGKPVIYFPDLFCAYWCEPAEQMFSPRNIISFYWLWKLMCLCSFIQTWISILITILCLWDSAEFFFLPVFNLLNFNNKPHGEVLGLQSGSVLRWLVALPKYHYFPFHSI